MTGKADRKDTQTTAKHEDASSVKAAFLAAIPIVLGYVALGVPCGVLAQHSGMDVWMVLALSVLLYSGTGQYMIPSLYLAGVGPLGIISSVVLVCSRQLLYASALIPFVRGSRRFTAFTCAAGITDESFAVNMERFEKGLWSAESARLVNLFSQASWVISNVLGFVLSSFISIDTAIASFAMTAIFVCLLFTQKVRADIVVAGVAAVIGVVIAKLVGLNSPAIFVGAVIGVVAGMLCARAQGGPAAQTAGQDCGALGCGCPEEGIRASGLRADGDQTRARQGEGNRVCGRWGEEVLNGAGQDVEPRDGMIRNDMSQGENQDERQGEVQGERSETRDVG